MSAPVRRSARIRPPKRGRLAAKEPCEDPLVSGRRLYCPEPPSMRRPVPPPTIRPVGPVVVEEEGTEQTSCTLLGCIRFLLRRLFGQQPSGENGCTLRDCLARALLLVIGLLGLLVLLLFLP